MARIGLTLPRTEDGPRREIVEIVQQAERLRYESVWVGESWGRDGFTWLTPLACHTHTIQAGDGHHPGLEPLPGVDRADGGVGALIHQEPHDAISAGRAILGLGTSGPIVIDNWHVCRLNVPYDGRGSPLRSFALFSVASG